MPFDGTDFNRRGDPKPVPRPWGLLERFLCHLTEISLTFIALISALLVGGVSGAAIDGFSDLPPLGVDISSVPSRSLLAQTVCTVLCLSTLIFFVWWRVRRPMAE